MTINKTVTGDQLVCAVSGRLDTTTAPELDAFLAEALEGVKDLVFDFNELEYVSSAGLRTLLSTQKKMNTQGAMKIVGVNSIINEVFEITGFSNIFTIETK